MSCNKELVYNLISETSLGNSIWSLLPLDMLTSVSAERKTDYARSRQTQKGRDPSTGVQGSGSLGTGTWPNSYCPYNSARTLPAYNLQCQYHMQVPIRNCIRNFVIFINCLQMQSLLSVKFPSWIRGTSTVDVEHDSGAATNKLATVHVMLSFVNPKAK